MSFPGVELEVRFAPGKVGDAVITCLGLENNAREGEREGEN